MPFYLKGFRGKEFLLVISPGHAIFEKRGSKSMTRTKMVVGLTAIIFLIFTFACAHSGGKYYSSPHEPITSANEIRRSLNEPYKEAPWWDNPEYAWIFSVLIIIGIGVAIGGTIYIASGAGGLHVAVSR